MDSIINFIFSHAPHAHYIIFGSMILAGFNLPISEDFMIIVSAILASTVIPENAPIIFMWLFLGCYISDWIVYWIGRLLGPKLLEMQWFRKTVSKKRLGQIQRFYRKYGFYTLLIGRFIPFGVRNCLFLTAGMSKMKFSKFVISDGIACFASNLTLFMIVFTLGKNYEAIFPHLKTINIFIFVAFLVTIITFICYYKKKKAARRR